MKKLLLSLFMGVVALSATSQVIFQVKAPSGLSGLYEFTNNGDGSGWGLADLTNPADAVEDTLMLVDDGTPGTNAQGHPFSAEGCSPLINDLTGKIAVIFRYDGVSDNSCGFGTKALNAQNAGAVGVVIINREPGLISMSGGTDGANVTIPVAFISSEDGELLYQAMQNGDDVVVFIGSKMGILGDDLGFLPKDLMIAKQGAIPGLLAQNDTEYSHEMGAKVRNFGSNNQTGVTITATVEHGGNTIYNETSDPFDIAAADSNTFMLPTFSNSTYPAGRYKVTYSINSSTTDEDASDNQRSFEFMVTDTLFSLSPLDTVTALPTRTTGTQPSTFNTDYSSCIVFQNAHASRIKAEGIYFSAVTNSTDSLSNQEIQVSVQEMLDVFTDMNDAPATGAVNLTPLTLGYYYYPEGPQNNLQGTVVYAPFDEMVALEDDKRYMFCVQVNTNIIFVGYSTKLNYESNFDYYLQPLVPVTTDGSTNLVGFGADYVPAIAVKMSENDLNVTELNEIEIKAYPNPTSGKLTIKLPESGTANITVTDVTGKQVMNSSITVENGKSTLNTDQLDNGMYLLNVTINNKVAQLQFVKQ